MRQLRALRCLLLVTAFIACSAVVDAAPIVLADWHFIGPGSSVPSPPTIVAPGVVAGNFTPVNIVADTQGCGDPAIFCGSAARFGLIGTDFADPLTDLTKYFSFTVGVTDPGTLLALATDGIWARVYHQVGFRNGYIVLRSSLDGFASNVGVAHVTSDTWTESVFNLPVGNVPSVEFRLYAFDDPADTRPLVESRLAMDEVTVEGNVQSTAPLVPEPGSMVLLGSGLVGLIAAARRRFRA